VYNNTALHMRGRRNLDAVLAYLDAVGGLLTTATDVVMTGTSAGGLATYLHADVLRRALPASATLVALPDAG
jgi:O-palmitoleoyl-L-serine hydrolase